MCPTACWVDFAPGRPARTKSATCVGRSRAMENSAATKNAFAATSAMATTRPKACRLGPAAGGPGAVRP